MLVSILSIYLNYIQTTEVTIIFFHSIANNMQLRLHYDLNYENQAEVYNKQINTKTKGAELVTTLPRCCWWLSRRLYVCCEGVRGIVVFFEQFENSSNKSNYSNSHSFVAQIMMDEFSSKKFDTQRMLRANRSVCAS